MAKKCTVIYDHTTEDGNTTHGIEIKEPTLTAAKKLRTQLRKDAECSNIQIIQIETEEDNNMDNSIPEVSIPEVIEIPDMPEEDTDTSMVEPDTTPPTGKDKVKTKTDYSPIITPSEKQMYFIKQLLGAYKYKNKIVFPDYDAFTQKTAKILIEFLIKEIDSGEAIKVIYEDYAEYDQASCRAMAKLASLYPKYATIDCKFYTENNNGKH